MTSYEYSSYSTSSTGGGAGGDVSNTLFNQADANKDGTLDKGEFSNFLSGGAAGLGAGVGVGGASGGFGSSYESTSYSSTGGAAGLDAGFSGLVGGASFDASNVALGGGLVGGGLAGGSSYDVSTVNYGVDAGAVNQAASYTAETNAAWSQYGAEVRGAGLFVDTNPQIIRRAAPGGVQTYTQNIKIRFLQPPAVPPPGPLIIKEVRPPQPPPPPPLRIKQQAPPLPQPPPLVLREKPPQPPATVASQTVVKTLAALPVPPRSVIIERIPAAPPKPRDIIIERWVPYGAAAKRKTIVQRAAAAKAYAAPRNIIIQYEQPQVRIVRQFQRLGVVQTNPQAYVQQYGAQLLDAVTLVQQARAAGVVEDISPPAAAAAVGFSASSATFGQDASLGLAGAGFSGAAGADLSGLASGSFSSSSYESSSLGGAGFGGVGLEGGLGGGAGFVGGAELAGGVGGGFSSSGYESSSFSSTGGAVGSAGGFDLASATFNSADTNKDGSLNAQEFNNFVQGGL